MGREGAKVSFVLRVEVSKVWLLTGEYPSSKSGSGQVHYNLFNNWNFSIM